MPDTAAKNIKLRNSLFLVLTALIWGFSFVAQAVGGKSIGVFSFNCLRSLMGSAVLLPIESVFSAFAGWLILGQQLSSRELAGCVIIFAAIILAQLPLSKPKG